MTVAAMQWAEKKVWAVSVALRTKRSKVRRLAQGGCDAGDGGDDVVLVDLMFLPSP